MSDGRKETLHAQHGISRNRLGRPCIDCGDGPCDMNCGPAVPPPKGGWPPPSPMPDGWSGGPARTLRETRAAVVAAGLKPVSVPRVAEDPQFLRMKLALEFIARAVSTGDYRELRSFLDSHGIFNNSLEDLDDSLLIWKTCLAALGKEN